MLRYLLMCALVGACVSNESVPQKQLSSVFQIADDANDVPATVSGRIKLYSNVWEVRMSETDSHDCLALAFPSKHLPDSFPGEFMGEISGTLRKHELRYLLDATFYEVHGNRISNSTCLNHSKFYLLVDNFILPNTPLISVE